MKEWLEYFTDIILSYCEEAEGCKDCKWYDNGRCKLRDIQDEIYEDSKPRTIIEMSDPVDAGEEYPY